MRAILYGLACTILFSACLVMSLLARLAPGPLLFAIGGAVLSGLILGAWVVLGATAGAWPRPRTGQVLIAAGAAVTLLNLWQAHWLAALWSLLVLAAGVGFAVQIFPVRKTHLAKPGSVRPPLGRREQM